MVSPSAVAYKIKRYLPSLHTPRTLFHLYNNCCNASVMITAGQHFPNKPEIICKAFSSLGPTSGWFSFNLSPYSEHIPTPDFGLNSCRNAGFSRSPGSDTSWLISCLQRLSKWKLSSFRGGIFLNHFRIELLSKTLEYQTTEYKPKLIKNCPSNPLAQKSCGSHSLSWNFFACLIRSIFFKGLLHVTSFFCLPFHSK